MIVDVENEPGGLERMHALGARVLPCVAKGKEFLIAKNLKAVAEFVGVKGPGYTMLPPEILFKKWMNILQAAQRYVRQFAGDRINESAIPERNRPLRLLCYHVFRIPEAFLQSAVHGVADMDNLIRAQPADGYFRTGEELARYGERVTKAVEQWWNELGDKKCERKIQITDYGLLTLHQLLERSTWHSAHHTRQLVNVLERFNMAPDGGYNREDWEGLPLPKRIWD